jgi:hypothetical protein
MSGKPYRARILAALDSMRTHEKDRILIGFIDALFPGGNPDHEVSGADFIAEAIRLLAAFHPCNVKPPEEPPPTDSQDLEF